MSYLRINRFSKPRQRLCSDYFNSEHPDENYIEPVVEMVSVCCGVILKPDSDICWSCNNHTELKELEV